MDKSYANTCYDPSLWSATIKYHSGDYTKAVTVNIPHAKLVSTANMVMKKSNCSLVNGTINCPYNLSKGGIHKLNQPSLTVIEAHSKEVTTVIEVLFPDQKIVLPYSYYVEASVYCNGKLLMNNPFDFNCTNSSFIYDEEEQAWSISQRHGDRAVSLLAQMDQKSQQYEIFKISAATNLGTATYKTLM